ncbi:MAG: hypothetical protein ACREAT_00010 [Nitrosotalea sp.]
MATTTTDSSGKFSAIWNTVPKDNGMPFHFYAMFIGGKSFGYTKSEVYESVVEKSDKPSANTIP